jgi:hypothetical protein
VYSVESRFDFQSPDQPYWNETDYADTFWGPPVRIGHTVPDGAVICVVFRDFHNGGCLHHNPAWETVHA